MTVDLLRRPVIFCAIVACLSPRGIGGDWPQILGPNRDGVAGDETLSDWPDSGPKELWSKTVGEGYAGVAVRGDRLVLFHRVAHKEIVEARNIRNGEVLWFSTAACDYRCGMCSDSGPRCVPLIANDRVYTHGANGMLRCLNAVDGKQIWRRDTWKDFKALEGFFGAGSTPLLVGNSLIVNVGGRNDSAVVAFSAEDGSTLWQSFDDKASYSSPVLATFHGQQHAIVITRLHALSLNPETGAIHFRFPFGARGPTVNGACPVVMNDHLFVSSSYRIGSIWARVNADGADLGASGEELLATQYATPVKYGDVLFAVDGRQDQSASLCCIDPAAQKVLWRKPGFAYGSLIRAGEELLLLTCEGDLIRFKANTLGYREVRRHSVLKRTSSGYRLPALSNGRLFIRDNDTLKCLVVGTSSSARG